MQSKQTFSLEKYTDVIGYTPILHEPDYTLASPLTFFKGTIHSIPAELHNDPFVCAEYYYQLLHQKPVAIFIPGLSFDRFGTRHGRGGGWYDRFLSQVPREWLRIGVINHTDYSKERLFRNTWDEPMDIIMVHNSSTDTWVVNIVAHALK